MCMCLFPIPTSGRGVTLELARTPGRMIPRWPMLLSGLLGAGMLSLILGTAGPPASKSPAVTEGAERSGAWPGRRSGSVGAAGAGASWKGDLGLTGTAEETDAVGGQTASPAWAGTAHLVSAVGRWSGVQPSTRTGSVSRIEEGRNKADAGRTAQSVAGSTALGRRRQPRTRDGMTDTVCASSRDGCILDARRTSDGVYPGRGVTE